ncbi:hypothetical protein A7981_06200 [Methylovorus sp. MM2]|uniref:hypothetical protein n=1 Tax=Methylovorus sp. MM2 TaxID=1848038 RepID=UPI0007DE6875|nr:hypothetical protein [Methylovorus sp. MM2]OAM53017.1 hypothetical protein A7981_06200 [Methylovorus sp. MM2]
MIKLVMVIVLLSIFLGGCNKEPAHPEPPATEINPTALKILQELNSPLADQQGVQRIKINTADDGIYAPEKRRGAKRISL